MVWVRPLLMLAANEPFDELVEPFVAERHVRCAERRNDLDAYSFQVGPSEHDDRSEAKRTRRVWQIASISSSVAA